MKTCPTCGGSGELPDVPKCVECGEEFEPVRTWKRFCSTECRYANWNRLNPRVKVKDD